MKIKPTLNDRLMEEVKRCQEAREASPRLVEMFVYLASSYLGRPHHKYLVDRDDMIAYAVEQLMKCWPKLKLDKITGERSMYGVLMITVSGAMIYYSARKRKNETWRTE